MVATTVKGSKIAAIDAPNATNKISSAKSDKKYAAPVKEIVRYLRFKANVISSPMPNSIFYFYTKTMFLFMKMFQIF